MTPAALLAGLAGVAAAAGIVELAAALGATRTMHAVRVPVALLSALAGLGRRVGAPAPPGDLAARLAAAGAPWGLSVSDVMSIKGGAALLGLLGAMPLGAALPGRLPLLAALALPVAGFLAPDAWLRRRARARGRAMELELPDVLDLLRVALQAGLPLGRGLAEVARRDPGTLAREWRRAATELELGVARDRVLEDLRRRCPAPGMPALVSALQRAARHGAPLAQTLAAQAREARSARARRIREDAARAAPKIQLVVALLLVPSVLLLVAAALLSALQ